MLFIENQETSECWDTHVLSCVDYNIYQSYTWGEYQKSQGWDVQRYIYRNDGKSYALSQCLVKKIEWLDACVIWIPGGPLFSDHMLLHGLLDALKESFNSYKCIIRINQLVQRSHEIEQVLRKSNFYIPRTQLASPLTFWIDTMKTDEKLIMDMSPNWRHNLKRALKKEMEFYLSDNVDELKEFYSIYIETAKLKKIKIYFTFEQIETIKRYFKDNFRLFLVKKDGITLSGRGVIIFGKKVFDIIAATSIEGRRNYASYLMIFNILKWCRDKNFVLFDFSGVDPLTNKGVYDFKKGVGGRLVEFAGEWEYASHSIYGSAFNTLIRIKKIWQWRG